MTAADVEKVSLELGQFASAEPPSASQTLAEAFRSSDAQLLSRAQEETGTVADAVEVAFDTTLDSLDLLCEATPEMWLAALKGIFWPPEWFR